LAVLLLPGLLEAVKIPTKKRKKKGKKKLKNLKKGAKKPTKTPLQSCTREDPCKTKKSARNSCTLYADGHMCSCHGRYFPGEGAKSCEFRPDPCRGDPCSTSKELDNVCTELEGQLGPDNFLCLCNGLLWKSGPGGKV
jgi:hypothetical protein